MLGCIISSPVMADFYTEINLFAYSGPVSIHSAINDWVGDYNGGDNALTHNHAEVGVSRGDWKFGLVRRYDYEIEVDDATAEFVHRVKNKKALQFGKVYPLNFKVRHTSSDGFRVRYRFINNQELSLTAGLSLLRGLWLTEGQVSGQAIANSDKDYTFSFDVDYYYSEDQLFERKVDAPSGYGFSTDLAIKYRPQESILLTVDVVDLLGLIYWLDTPRTVAQANSDTKTFGEDGYVVYQPLVSGRETNEDYGQRLATTISFLSVVEINRLQMLAKLYKTRLEGLYEWGFGYTAGGVASRIYYAPQNYALRLEFAATSWQFSLIADTLNRREASVFAFKLAFEI